MQVREVKFDQFISTKPYLRLAQEYGFDAVNLDVDYVVAHGPEKVKDLLKVHGLQPAAFRFPIKLTDEADFIGDGEGF